MAFFPCTISLGNIDSPASQIISLKSWLKGRNFMKLSQKQKKVLKGLGHHLNPIITVGKEGISEAVILEARQILNTHELIKVKFLREEREEFIGLVNEFEKHSRTQLVQTIGRIAIFYAEAKAGQEKKLKKAKISLPNI